MYWSICVPSSCTVDEVKFVIKEIFTLATKQKNVNVRLSEDKCHIKKPQPFSTMEIVYG